MSRQPTWDTACRLQAEMFREAAAIGGLDVQLVYFRGLNECRASRWVSDGAGLGELMGRIHCIGGHTQIRKVLSHARGEHARGKVAALVYVGDAMEEAIDDLAAGAGELGLLGIPAFVFQEGHDPVAETGVPRDRAADARRLLPLRPLGRARACRTAARGGGLCGGRRQGARRPVGEAQRGRAEAARADEITMTLLFGLAALAVLLWMAQKYLKADPRKLAAVLKLVGRRRDARLCGVARGARPLRHGGAACRPRAWPARLDAVRAGGLRGAHAEKLGPGLARALGVPRDGARSRHRRDARRDPHRPARRARGSRRSTWIRWSACSARSMTKAARYWQRILTAGIPPGVSTRRPMRQRGGAARRAGQ